MTENPKGDQIVHTCKECSNQKEIKLLENEVSKGIWECPECGHPHSEDEFMEYVYSP